MRRLLFLLVCLTACSTPGTKVDRPPEQQARVDAAIKNREVRLGMTGSEVLAAWGKPHSKSKAMQHGKSIRVWSYGISEIYFDSDGFVVGGSAPGY